MAVKWKWKPAAGGSVPAGLEQKVNQNETNITNLQNDYLSKTTTTTQSMASQITFTKTGEVVKITPNSDTASYISGYKSGNQRVWYFGKSSSTDNHLRIGADRGNIKVEPNGVVDLSSKKISFLADPAANQDAANKQYVDNRIKTRTLTQTINTNSSFTVAPTQGYQIVNVMIGRKRTSDNYFFFIYHETLNFQFYVNSSNNFIIWNQGNVSGFNNEYKIIITEMKV